MKTATLLLLMTMLAGNAAAQTPARPRPRPPAKPPATPVVSANDAPERQALLVAEDARANTAPALDTLMTGMKNANPAIQSLAVRAVGRLERADLVAHLVPLLSAAATEVRLEAANAIGQSLAATPIPGTPGIPPDAVTAASTALLARLAVEGDPGVRGVVCETLGRLPYTTVDPVRAAEAAIVNILPASTADARTAPLTIGAVKGLETLYRVQAKIFTATPAVVESLRTFLSSKSSSPRLQRLAVMALLSAKGMDAATIDIAAASADPQVRRLAMLATATLEPRDRREPVLARGLADPDVMVRYEALKARGTLREASGCAPIVAAVADPSPHVSLLAIDLLASCQAPDAADALVKMLPAAGAQAATAPAAWHGPAHALVSLARARPEAARTALPAAAESPVWQVRMYGARAAAALHEGAWLLKLAADQNDNVREAAVEGLSQTAGHDGDRFYIDALARPDYQVVRTAAVALKGAPAPRRREAVDALLRALERISTDKRDTSRDARVAILERIKELGSVADAPALTRYLEDFDWRIAGEAAAILTTWTGQAKTMALKPLPAQEVPAPQEIAGFATATAVVTMQGGRTFTLKLLPAEAPVTAARFAKLARAGYYNGLTFHRVVPNFVIQGGSPGANEYMGDGPYLRDELGLRSHERGTLGISTRGRDTGDAQIFVNLVDNPRLDHNFTVFAEITQGLEVVDGILEGDVIEKVDIR